jgi:hypothetical protein
MKNLLRVLIILIVVLPYISFSQTSEQLAKLQEYDITGYVQEVKELAFKILKDDPENKEIKGHLFELVPILSGLRYK